MDYGRIQRETQMIQYWIVKVSHDTVTDSELPNFCQIIYLWNLKWLPWSLLLFKMLQNFKVQSNNKKWEPLFIPTCTEFLYAMYIKIRGRKPWNNLKWILHHNSTITIFISWQPCKIISTNNEFLTIRIMKQKKLTNFIVSVECNPECKNGGICIRPNYCHCPDGWKGSYCQHGLHSLEIN